jgi:predicted nucleic acid-binding protein
VIAVDANVWIAALADSGRRGAAARAVLGADDVWVAPMHASLEMLRTLRKFLHLGALDQRQADRLVLEVLGAPVRYVAPTNAVLRTVWSLRDNVSIYDAPYVALALDAQVPLVTADKRLARAARLLGVDAIVPEDVA